MLSTRRWLITYGKAIFYKERKPMTSGNVMPRTAVEYTIAVSLMHGTRIEGLRRATVMSIAIWIMSPAATRRTCPVYLSFCVIPVS